VLEIVDDALAIEKVHGGAEEIPVQRLGEAQTAGLAGHICNCNDLLERYNLHCGNNDDEVDVAGTQDPEETEDHDETPYGARYEVGLLLLVLGPWCWFRFLRVSAGNSGGRGGQPTEAAMTPFFAPFLMGLEGRESFSLISDMLCEGRRARPLLALRWLCWNFTSLRGRVMLATCGVRRVCWCDTGAAERVV
jgi:hypothetical protein